MGSVKENKMKILLLFIGLYFGFDAVSGHGSMYIPSPWHATSDCDNSMDPKNCEFGLVVPETEDYKCKMTARGQWPGGPGGCSRNAGFTFWFTNYTTVEEFNIPKEMYDKWSGRQSYAGKNPWNSPGAAPSKETGVESMEEINLVAMEKILCVEDVVWLKKELLVVVRMLVENQPWNIIKMDFLERNQGLDGKEENLQRFIGV